MGIIQGRLAKSRTEKLEKREVLEKIENYNDVFKKYNQVLRDSQQYKVAIEVWASSWYYLPMKS